MCKDIIDGATELLVDTVSLLSDCKYLIIGGWAPFLRCKGSITHPGTQDVDILFSQTTTNDDMERIATKFEENDFVISAKHRFQFLKTIKVGGKKIAFNVDFLHPTELKNPKSIFRKHFEWPILSNRALKIQLPMKSIALPSSTLLFDELFSNYRFMYNEKEINFPLIDEIGIILTKSGSYKIKKRYRDSFDIYLALKQPQNIELFQKKIVEKRQQLKKLDRILISFVDDLKVEENKSIFDSNVSRFHPDEASPSEFVISELDRLR